MIPVKVFFGQPLVKRHDLSLGYFEILSISCFHAHPRSLKSYYVLRLRFSDWPISIHNWVYIFHSVLSDPDSDV